MHGLDWRSHKHSHGFGLTVGWSKSESSIMSKLSLWPAQCPQSPLIAISCYRDDFAAQIATQLTFCSVCLPRITGKYKRTTTTAKRRTETKKNSFVLWWHNLSSGHTRGKGRYEKGEFSPLVFPPIHLVRELSINGIVPFASSQQVKRRPIVKTCMPSKCRYLKCSMHYYLYGMRRVDHIYEVQV